MTRAQMHRLIGGVFGLVYVVVNAGALPSPAAPVLRALAIAAFVALVVATRRAVAEPGGTTPQAMPFSWGYWLVVAAEAAAIVAGWAVISIAFHASYAAVGWISVVVGVHFAGLALVWRQRFFNWLGAAIAICGVTGLAAAAAGSSAAVIAAVAGVAPGALLLAAGFWRISRYTAGRARAADPSPGTPQQNPDPARGAPSRRR
jgi:hypothetical protein